MLSTLNTISKTRVRGGGEASFNQAEPIRRLGEGYSQDPNHGKAFWPGLISDHDSETLLDHETDYDLDPSFLREHEKDSWSCCK